MRISLALMAALLSPMAQASDGQRLETCRAGLIKAQQLHVLYDMQWRNHVPHVVAGPGYYQMPFDGKEGFAALVNCFMLAGKQGCLSFDIKHWQTGKPTDHYHLCKLKPE